MTAPAVQINGLSKSYGKLSVLKHFSLDVTKGEFVSLVGPSGCGKTTLLKIIGGLEQPSSGEVLLDGLPPTQRRRDGQLGFVFQKPVLLPWRTLEQNIRLPLEILHPTDVNKQIPEILKEMSLAGFEKSYPQQLSGGMQQRAALARVFLYNPPQLLMDEPFGSVDEITRGYLNLELLKVWEKYKTTILFVTHSIEEAVLLSDRVVILSSRPAQINQVVTIDLPRPRSRETLNLEKFHNLVRCIRNTLNNNLSI